MKSYTIDTRVVHSNVPQELRSLPQWVAWRWGKTRKTGKREKVPIDPRTGRRARANDPATWGTFTEASSYARGHFMDGIGFVFSEDDPYCGLDLDGCLDPESGAVRLGADEVLDALDTYAEISPSGTGIKAILRARKPGDRCSTKSTPWGDKIEIYDRDRFFTITGNVYRDAPVEDAQEALNGMYGRFFLEDGPKVRVKAGTPSRGFPGDNEALLEAARNCSKTGARFRKLYDHGDTIRVGERSEADLELCGMLVYWCGPDPERVKELFRQSALAQGKYREKGRHGEAYLEKTVNKAISSCTNTYDPEYGDRLKAQAREIVSRHRTILSEAGASLRENKRAVMSYMLTIAATRGKVRNGSVKFNANQEEMAETLGISQPAVSKIIRELCREGWLHRVSKGKKGKNSVYRLPAIGSITYADRVGSSTTYEHSGSRNPTPVGLRSRTSGEPPNDMENPLVKLQGRGQGYFPTTVSTAQPKEEMVRNLPSLGEDGVYHHGPECRCGFFCDEDAPAFVPADDTVAEDVA